MKRLRCLINPVISWILVISWTILTIVLLLKPGNDAMNYAFTFSSFFQFFFFSQISLKDLSEAMGHVILFGVLTILWQRALIMSAFSNAFVLTIIIVIILAICTEIGQYFVNRSSLFLDLLANFLGIMLSILWIKRQTNQQ